MRQRLVVFISSTVHDLSDARAELGKYLSSQGCVVKLSEDPESDFVVDPTTNAIESCLNNVESADAVICIVDKRYGGIIPHGGYAGKSPTEAEIQHAQKLGKPMFAFVREQALNDFQTLYDNGVNAKVRWVTLPDATRQLWVNFVYYLKTYPPFGQNRSNWFDAFRNSIDLRQFVERRLLDHFGKRFRVPGHIFRLSFGVADTLAVQDYRLENPNNEPAFALKVGIDIPNEHSQSVFYDALAGHASVLPYKHRMKMVDKLGAASKEIKEEVRLWCEYENAAGESFRIERGLTTPTRISYLAWNSKGEDEWVTVA